MTTAAIIGAGDLGGAIAHALASRESVRRVVLIDPARTVAEGKALDLRQMGAITGVHTLLEGSDDIARAIGCAVCILADRAGQVDAPDDAAFAVATQLADQIGHAPLVMAGAAHAELLLRVERHGLFRRERLIGSSPEALVSAIRGLVALEATCSPAEVMLTVLGVPPTRFVVPWADAAIGGYALTNVLSPVQINRLEARIATLWPPGPQALGTAAARVAEAIVHGSRRTFSVLTMLDGEFGVRHRVGTLPVLLSPLGIARTRVPSVSTRERVLVENALGG